MQERASFNGPIFIAGNSRSGTTLLMRAFNCHPNVHAVNEPHFWERLYLPEEENVVLDEEQQIHLMNRLICSQRQSFQREENIGQYQEESQHALAHAGFQIRNKLDVYDAFLHHEAARMGKQIPCEKTPRNVFYIPEILNRFSNAHVLVMVRDPRSVLLSQKNKWKRRKLGSVGFPVKEQIRLRLNYHPVVMSKLWRAGALAGRSHSSDRVHQVKFEDFVSRPQEVLQRLCEAIGISYSEVMLNVPQAGSSVERDAEGATGFRSKDSDMWRTHLNQTEIAISDQMTAGIRRQIGYPDAEVKGNVLKIALYYLWLPIKMSLALFLNLGRYRNLLKTIKSRL